jgi:hypothetical protein
VDTLTARALADLKKLGDMTTLVIVIDWTVIGHRQSLLPRAGSVQTLCAIFWDRT